MQKYQQLLFPDYEICDACQEQDKSTNLIKPCGNILCVRKLHEECLTLESQQNDMKCKGCGEFIVVTKVVKLKKVSCLSAIIGWVIYFSLILATPATMVTIAFGGFVGLAPRENVFVWFALSTGFFSLIMTSIVAFVGWQGEGHMCISDQRFSPNKWAFITFLIGNLIIVFDHILGYFVMKIAYSSNEFFTFRTCAYGYMISFCLIIAVIILSIIGFGLY